MELKPGRGSHNWCYIAIGSGATITDAGILSVNGTTTIDGASTLSGTVAIGGGYTNEGYTPLHGVITKDLRCSVLLEATMASTRMTASHLSRAVPISTWKA